MAERFEIMDNSIIIMVGLPGSGKSYVAKRIHKSIPGSAIVNRDAIRLSVHGKAFDKAREDDITKIERIMASSLLLSGTRVLIVDNCNLKSRWRKFWEDLGRASGMEVRYGVVRRSLSECTDICLEKGGQVLADVCNSMSQSCDVKEVLDSLASDEHRLEILDQITEV